MIRVLLADDHEVIRFGFRMLINATEDIELVGAAGDGLSAVAMTLRENPDVVVMDLSMPVLDGIAATAEILRQRPGTRVLVLTSYAENPIVRDAMAAGAAGYLVKDDPSATVLEGIRAVARGERPVAAKVAAIVGPDLLVGDTGFEPVTSSV